MTALATPAQTPHSQFLIEPATAEDLGLDRGILLDLAMKTLFYRGRMSCTDLARELCIAGSAMQEVAQALTQDELAVVLGSDGSGPASFVYALTQKGLDRAETALQRNGYVGAAPVPFAAYVKQVISQTMTPDNVKREHVEKALGSLVLSDSTVVRIGRAASSRKSALLYGASGNGKTTVAHALGSAIGGSILIPHAIEVVGQIIRIYDPSKHEILPDKAPAAEGVMKTRSDRRWLRIRRPVIWAGGELTKHSLELMYDESLRVYEAPLQLKANGGTLIIDDFGRQQMSPVALLNRWISALEGGIDHLTLHTGQMLEVPFDVLLLFSTNLEPAQLADEAFLRRIRYKVELPNPTREEYRAIMQYECELTSVRYDHHAVDYLFAEWYDNHDRAMRGCHPRDIVEAIADACSYEGHDAVLTPATIDEACSTYFLRPAGA